MALKEKNIEQLREALAKLPVYQAPDLVWEQVAKRLNSEEEAPLREGLRHLPTYTAPEASWNIIQGQLRHRSGFSRRWLLPLAAVLLLLILWSGLRLNLNKQVATSPETRMTEKKAKFSEPTDIQIADFKNQMALEEKELNECMEALDIDQQNKELRSEIKQFEELTQTRDSLVLLFSKGEGLPGTSPRLDRLEEKRKDMIEDLTQKLCQ